MYQPGMNDQLPKILYHEMLDNAARERANRLAPNARAKSVARWGLALAAAAPVAVVIWVLVVH